MRFQELCMFVRARNEASGRSRETGAKVDQNGRRVRDATQADIRKLLG